MRTYNGLGRQFSLILHSMLLLIATWGQQKRKIASHFDVHFTLNDISISLEVVSDVNFCLKRLGSTFR